VEGHEGQILGEDAAIQGDWEVPRRLAALAGDLGSTQRRRPSQRLVMHSTCRLKRCRHRSRRGRGRSTRQGRRRTASLARLASLEDLPALPGPSGRGPSYSVAAAVRGRRPGGFRCRPARLVARRRLGSQTHRESAVLRRIGFQGHSDSVNRLSRRRDAKHGPTRRE